MRKPTPAQADRLRVVASGSIVLFPKRTLWGPLLRRGWVERLDSAETPTGGWLPPLRITPGGLRALADALERDGWPDPPERTSEALAALAEAA